MNSEDKFEVWEIIKSFYREKFGTAPELVEIATDFDILKMCANGSGTPKIAEFLGIDKETIASILDIHFGFAGWKDDQPFSPLRIYNGLDVKDLESFRNVLITQYGYVDNETVEQLHTSAGLVSNLERLLDEKWI